VSRFIRIFASGDVTLSCSDENERKTEGERGNGRYGGTGRPTERERTAEGRFDEDPWDPSCSPRHVSPLQMRRVEGEGDDGLTKIAGFNFLHPCSRARAHLGLALNTDGDLLSDVSRFFHAAIVSLNRATDLSVFT